MNRLIIPVEFKKGDLEELELYERLKSYSAPGSMIKDILKKRISLDILYEKRNDNNND
ncbi:MULTISPECIES: hypothetical protein [unclassified Clostridium]|uniref:hypothetical protein n=1 Tax=Clostridium sp. UMB9555A TaxID=3050593 RepID=UPI002551B8D5|nr:MULTISPECIES: hypothetical protein [unclassified Clostridium]MDK7589890.1 hypothetical protein [Clostridium sp. UMB9555B]MDK7627716.1 hypothetical protein [Clostridium sp. UMB9555A]